MQTSAAASAANAGNLPALPPLNMTPVNLAHLTAKQLSYLLVAPAPELLVDCGAQLVPHPLGVCRFVAQLLQLRARGARLWLCNVHPGLLRYLHQLNLGAVFHLAGEVRPTAASNRPIRS